MAYTIANGRAGLPAITSHDTVQAVALGTQVEAYDPTYGQGAFIFLKGVASTVVGSMVTYDQLNGSTTLSPNTALLTNPLAVAMSACVAGEYGWYQVRGAAVIKKTATKVSPGSKVYQSGTTGRIMATSTASKQIQNAVSVNAATVASATSTVVVQIAYPFHQGQIV
jgi:hypothetical protein